jgi:hypothetical protein
MKLCAIYNIWDDWDLFNFSGAVTEQFVDGIIVVWSRASNWNEIAPEPWHNGKSKNVHYLQIEPMGGTPAEKETWKRQQGLNKAQELGYTHFITMDADEFYVPEEVEEAKKRFSDPSMNGLVCRCKTYFRTPRLTIGYDTTLVPFIHKIVPGLRYEFNRNYPFAWTDQDRVPFTPNKRIRIDPTRSFNLTSGIQWDEITMHHMSWVRSDLKKKVRNSTARMNIEKSTIVQDYLNAKEGYFCQFYGRTLEACENIFGVHGIEDKTLS